MARRMKWVWGIGAMLLALGAGGLAAYWFVERRGGPEGLPVGSRAVPANALMTLTFSTDAGQWEQLRRFGTPETQTQLNQYIATWRDRLLTDAGLDYGEDIAPWVGSAVTVAFLAADADLSESPQERDGNADSDATASLLDPSNPFDPELMALEDRSVAWILPISQPADARAALARFAAEGGSAPRDYRGSNVYQFEGRTQAQSETGETQSYWATVLGRRLLAIAVDSSDIEALIDAYEDNASVADLPGYRQAIQHVAAPQPFLQVYINSDTAAEVAAANSINGTPPQLMPLRKDHQGIVATAGLVEDGIDIDGATWLKSGVNQTFTGSSIDDVASFLPSDTVFVMAGGNLERLWQSMQQSAQTSGFLGPDNIRSVFNALTGLSMDEDLIPWMTDEYALALVAPTESTEASTDPSMGLVLQVKTDDRSTAEDALTRLDDAVSSRYDFQIAQNVVDEVPVVQWTSPFAALQVSRTWVDDNRLSMAIGSARPALSPDESLSQTDLFQRAIASSPSPNGYFFVNPRRLISLDRGLPLPSVPPKLQSIAAAIKAIGLKTTIPQDQTMRFDISVLLEQLEGPGTLPAPGTAEDTLDTSNAESSPAGGAFRTLDSFTEPPQ